MRHMNNSDPAPTTNLYVEKIVQSTKCEKHNASLGVPCYFLDHDTSTLRHTIGVCNKRAIKAGYGSPIDPRSLQAHRRK